MRTRRSSLLVSLCLSPMLLVACGTTTRSGIDGDKKLTDLSAEEVHQLCQWSVDRAAEGIDQQACPRAILVATKYKSTAECTEELPAQYKSCSDGTVSQFEDCALAELDEQSRLCSGEDVGAAGCRSLLESCLN